MNLRIISTQGSARNRTLGSSEACRQPTNGIYITPAVKVADGRDETVFSVHLPRVDADDIELAFVEGVLTLLAKCLAPSLDDAREALSGVFFRRFGLSYFADRTRVSACFAEGTLSIVVPYLWEGDDQARHVIPVTVAA